MTGPLSSAVNGASYNGAFGSDAGGVARLVAGLAQGAQEARERQSKVALDAALMKLREGDAEMRREEHEARMRPATPKSPWEAENFPNLESYLDYLRRRKQAEHIEKPPTPRSIDPLSPEGIQAALERKRRELELESRQPKPPSAEGEVSVELVDGRVGVLNKATGKIRIATFAEAEGTPLGRGARPTQSERDARASFDNLQDTFEQLDANMAKVGYRAPSIAIQTGLDASKYTGVGGSVVRSLANTAVGKLAPEYQLVQHSIDALGTLVTKMVTGAQMSEPEAQRIMNILRSTAGDDPALVQQKLQQVRTIIANERVKMGRAGGAAIPGSAEGAQPTNNAAARAAAVKAKYGLEPPATPSIPKRWTLPNGSVVDLE
jgi:hypothetical protein